MNPFLNDIDALPQWQCHKVVKADKITKIELVESGFHQITDSQYDLHLEGGSKGRFHSLTFTRYWPKVGDYVVVYEDGYISISPQKAFEEGYTRIAY